MALITEPTKWVCQGKSQISLDITAKFDQSFHRLYEEIYNNWAYQRLSRSQGCKKIMLNLNEHEISNAHNDLNSEKMWTFYIWTLILCIFHANKCYNVITEMSCVKLTCVVKQLITEILNSELCVLVYLFIHNNFCLRYTFIHVILS